MNKSILLAAVALTAALPWSGANAQRHDGRGGVVRCESIKERLQHCPLDSRGGVQLLKQISDSACVEGRTWGRDQRGIWVANGCRGEFLVGGGHGGGWQGTSQVFRCESEDERSRHCRANAQGRIVLVRQLSKASCIEGRTWGQDRDGVWVEAGCRGEFRVVDQGPNWNRWRGNRRNR